MLNADQIIAIHNQVIAGLRTAATVAGAVAPVISPALALGQAIAALEPELFAGVVALINGSEPTAADEAGLAAKVTELEQPSQI